MLDAFIIHLQTEKAVLPALCGFYLLFRSRTHFEAALKEVIKSLKFSFLKPEDTLNFFSGVYSKGTSFFVLSLKAFPSVVCFTHPIQLLGGKIYSVLPDKSFFFSFVFFSRALFNCYALNSNH